MLTPMVVLDMLLSKILSNEISLQQRKDVQFCVAHNTISAISGVLHGSATTIKTQKICSFPSSDMSPARALTSL